MTRSLEEANELSALDAKVLREIHTDGWQITGMLTSEREAEVGFAYSIGFFHCLGHPEAILFGLPLDTCMRAVNAIGNQVRSGMCFEADRVYTGILEEPFLCCFKEVERRHYEEHVGYALWFYEADPFPLMQCFWSDERGRFPWDKKCHLYVRQGQPLLFRK